MLFQPVSPSTKRPTSPPTAVLPPSIPQTTLEIEAERRVAAALGTAFPGDRKALLAAIITAAQQRLATELSGKQSMQSSPVRLTSAFPPAASACKAARSRINASRRAVQHIAIQAGAATEQAA